MPSIYLGENKLVGPQGKPGFGLPCGSIVLWTSGNLPAGWLLCDGTAISRTIFGDLYNVIGTTYGAGDGSSTFNLPNLKSRVAVGRDASATEFDVLGETGGEKTHILTTPEIPAHDHPIAFATSNGTPGPNLYYWPAAGTTNTAAAVQTSMDIQNTGGGGAHNNLQPYIVLNYIICYKTEGNPAVDVNTYTNLTGFLKGDGVKVTADALPHIPYTAIFDKQDGAHEGGQFSLQKAVNSTLSADIVFDNNDNRIRIFENGGSYRGAHLDIDSCADGVDNTDIWCSGNHPKHSSLNLIPTGPASFVSNTPQLITYSGTVDSSGGILSCVAATGAINPTKTCRVFVNYSQHITHSATPDVFHLEMYDGVTLLGTAASCERPANTTSTYEFSAIVSMTAGHSYYFKIRANGGSGTHTCVYTFARNIMNIFVVV